MQPPPDGLDEEVREILDRERSCPFAAATSLLLSPREAAALSAELRGEDHPGTGLAFPLYLERAPGEAPAIVTARRGSPAWRVGLRPGDELVAIDGHAAREMPAWEVGARLQPPAGASVAVEVRRRATVTLVAETLAGDATRIAGAPCPDGDVYLIAVPLIRAGAARAIEYELACAGARAIVLDLRDCAGGYLSEALAVAGLFLAKAPVALDRDRRTVLRAAGAAAWTGRLVVVVNEGTASAGELISAGLKSQRRALVVGMPTYGKVHLHRPFPLSGGWSLLVTVGAPVTLDGAPLHGHGVIPHVAAGPHDALPLAAEIARHPSRRGRPLYRA